MKIKLFSILLIGVVLFSMSLPTSYAAAEKTLGQLKAEAEANRKAYNAAKAEKELTEAETHEDIVWECADLMYFVNVLMYKEGVTWKEVFDELDRRHKKENQYKSKLKKENAYDQNY